MDHAIRVHPAHAVWSALTPAAGLASARAAFQGLAEGRIHLPAVGHVPGQGGAFHLKCAATASHALVKLNANFPANPDRGLPTVQGLVMLLDAGDGRPLALLDSASLTAVRTAAASALAATHLARRDARVLALIGCGVQGAAHLAALAACFDLTRVVLHDPRPARVQALAAQATALGLAVVVADSPAAAAREADLIVTATAATTPLLEAADTRPGQFIAAVGADAPHKHELAPALLRAARVVADLAEQALSLGDCSHVPGWTRADLHAGLADLVSGRAPGRQRADEVFVFDSTGCAAQDLTAALAVDAALTTAPTLTLST